MSRPAKQATTAPGAEPRSPLVPIVQRVESAATLDAVADRLTPLAAPTVSSDRVRGWLRGDWLGHAVHPLLTDLPIGAWTSTNLLDLFGGRRSRPAAEALLVFGLATATPTAVTGAAEWLATTGGRRRVGVVHALCNLTAFGLYGASFVMRRRGRHRMGVGLGLLGGATASVGGYLGGHLTVARDVGTRDPAFDDGS
jgi:uncharacterized membrane protein